MEDVSPDVPNWQRLFNAFVNSQITWQYGNHVVMFITRAMDPAEYNGNLGVFIDRRQKLNVVSRLPAWSWAVTARCVQSSRRMVSTKR